MGSSKTTSQRTQRTEYNDAEQPQLRLCESCISVDSSTMGSLWEWKSFQSCLCIFWTKKSQLAMQWLLGADKSLMTFECLTHAEMEFNAVLLCSRG